MSATLTPDQIRQLQAAGVALPPEVLAAAGIVEAAPEAAPEVAPAPVAPAPAPAAPQSVSERIAAMQAESGCGANGMSLMDALAGLDGSKATSRDYRLFSEDYDIEAQIVKAEIDNHNGKNRLRLELLTTFPQQDAGFTIFDDVYLTQAALFRFKSLCEACEMWKDHAFSGKSEQDFVGCIVRFRVKTDTFNPEKPRSKVNGKYYAGSETPGLQAAA